MSSESYLLDTSIASAAGYAGHRLHNEVRAKLDRLPNDAVFVSAVSLAETEYGLNLVPSDKQMQRDVRTAMARYKVLPIDRHTAEIYGKVRAILFKQYAPQRSPQQGRNWLHRKPARANYRQSAWYSGK